MTISLPGRGRNNVFVSSISTKLSVFLEYVIVQEFLRLVSKL